MSSNSQSKTFPLVWVTHGKTQHPAFLLETNVAEQRSFIQWTSNDKTEWVGSRNILVELPSRRRRSDQNDIASSPVSERKSSVETFVEEASSTPSRKKQKTARRSQKADITPCVTTILPQIEDLVTDCSSKQIRPDESRVSRRKLERLDSNRATVNQRHYKKTRETSSQSASSKAGIDSDCSDDRPLIELAKTNKKDCDEGDDDIELLLTIRPPSPSLTSAVDIDTTIDRDLPPKVGSPNHNLHEKMFHSTYWPSFVATEKNAPLPHSREQKAPIIPTRDSGVASLEFLPSEKDGASTGTQYPPMAPCFFSSTPVDTSREYKDPNVREIPSDDTSKASPETIQYTLRTSAYLQNLSEICFTILLDRRWRTDGVPMQPLFQWEEGDDLSVVTALSRLYIPRPRPPGLKCACLLCRDENTRALQSIDQKAAIPTSLSTEECLGAKPTARRPSTSGEIHETVLTVTKSIDIDELDETTTNPHADDQESRSMYLYSRLFYRKGPWFRLDDVYSKYYTDSKSSSQVTHQSDDTGGSSRSPVKPSVRRFFEAVPTDITEPAIYADATSSSSFDPEVLKTHLEVYLPRMLTDVDVLLEAGMIRFFNDEVECGKTIGFEILTALERTVVLSKLGAGKKRPKRTGGTTQVGNEIWKQMRQQQLSFAATKATEKTVLPVRRHVEDLILERLARAIVQSSSRNAHLSSQTIYDLSQSTLTSIKRLISDRQHASSARYEGMCFRPREEPTRALQRCVRLYLCATSGPGSMRGDGTNGWRSTRSVNVKKALLAHVLSPPGQHTWYQVQYPGLSLRFGLSSACFLAAYAPLTVKDDNVTTMNHFFEQVFSSRKDFLRWEVCAELRAHVDYLLELNEIHRSELRRRALGKTPRHKSSTLGGMVDFLSLLTHFGREAVLTILMDADEDRIAVLSSIESDLTKALSSLESDTEKVLGTIGVVSLHVLCCRDFREDDTEMRNNRCRPWLRHMSWRSCLAYVLFDVIPILERRCLYELSVRALQVLLFGVATSPVNSNCEPNYTEYHHQIEWSSLVQCFLSRRARGKALDRLLVDLGHIHRLRCVSFEKASRSVSVKEFQLQVGDLCKRAIESVAHSSSVAFSAIRMMARRLKRPLRDSLGLVLCLESIELGLRFDNDAYVSPRTTVKHTKYSDWTPITDTAVANSIGQGKTEPGSRCSYIGFDDDTKFSSLNVEEFAMELYKSGRLPNSDTPTLTDGGWVGWHNEGGHFRALFRILCAAPVLGMDFGCAYQHLSAQELLEHATVHLSPYQQVPFDLHVGCESETAKWSEGDQSSFLSKGFYGRRNVIINRFLHVLETMTTQHVADLVYDSVICRLNYATASKVADPFLERDLMQVRTLSAVAAGLGGMLLSAAFRCLLFDYRHYSGGLPDLHLFRALYECEGSPMHGQQVDLGLWIGESFSVESQQAASFQRTTALLSDRDDEFLGCSKVGESNIQASVLRRGGKLSNTLRKRVQYPTSDLLPARLHLVHNICTVKVECMMVEVKSSNDRLDPRQEDWLNILDRHGNARVCKFEGSRKPS